MYQVHSYSFNRRMDAISWEVELVIQITHNCNLISFHLVTRAASADKDGNRWKMVNYCTVGGLGKDIHKGKRPDMVYRIVT